MNRKSKNNKRLWLLFGVVPIVFLGLISVIIIWWRDVEAEAHTKPPYSQEDISKLVYSESLILQDYELLFRQTGLSASAVDALRAQSRQQELLTLQENLFADIEIKCEPNTIVSREERIADREDYVSIPYVENGDILITFNSHALGWRNGHAAIVVDGERDQTLEARVLGTDSKVMSMSHWEQYPSFAVLRLKGASKEQRAEIAAYALENLTDIPYRLEAGIWGRVKKSIEDWWGIKESRAESGEKKKQDFAVALSGTHCAHLIWYVYDHFGYDLDSDAGIIVTPRDIYESPHLELIQIYGMQLGR